jgi:hypothetical protein
VVVGPCFFGSQNEDFVVSDYFYIASCWSSSRSKPKRREPAREKIKIPSRAKRWTSVRSVLFN